MIQYIVTSFLAFASTNVDDLFILMLFFGSGKYKSSHIIAGQYLGISMLVVISLAGSLIGTLIDTRYIGFLGLFPIYLGVKQAYDLFKKQSVEDEEEVSLSGKRGDVVAIAMVTVANGGDNIGIYVPLLATLEIAGKMVFLAVFSIMVFLWCRAAKYLADRPLMAKALNRYAHVIMPLVLFFLGVFILVESDTFSLF